MQCLVTGGGGFFGSELTRQLIHRNYKVQVLLKEKESTLNLSGLDVKTVTGDIRDKALLKRIVSGVDYIFHAASVYDTTPFYVKNPKELYDINVEGTRNICEAALKANVQKLVYTGSTAGVGLRQDGQPADESVKLNFLNQRSHYEQSKALAQEVVLSYHKAGLWVVCVSPSFLIGPGDLRPTPTGEMIVNFLKRRYPCYFDGRLCLSDVKSAAQAHIDVLDKGRSGQSYIVAHERFYTIQELFQILEKLSGVPSPKLKLPLSWLLLFSLLNEALIGLLRLRAKVRPLIASELVRYLGLGCTYNSAKAKRELGFTPSSLEETIKESVDWYRRNLIQKGR